jgi:hypothetical protein
VNDILNRLAELETSVTYTQPPPHGERPFRHMLGRLPILISAPHGAAHLRDGQIKQEDEYTAAFVRLVAERTGAHSLYTWAQSDGDPNWDRQSPYKDFLQRIVTEHDIQFVLDIHGMSNRHKFGIAVGTICGVSCPQHHEALITEALIAEGFQPITAAQARELQTLRWESFVINHHRFTGGLTSHTVTRFVRDQLGLHAAQIELCADIRIVQRYGSSKWPDDFKGNSVGIMRAITAIENMVGILSKHSIAR